MLKNTIIRKAALLLAAVFTTISMATVNVSASVNTLEQTIINGINANKDEIDISSLNIDPQSAVKAFTELKNTDPNLFCVDGKVNCKFSGSKAKSLVVSYDVPKNQISAERTAIDAQVTKIAALAAKGATDAEKAQIVVDYFKANTQYDYSHQCDSVYDVLVNNKGICVGYAQAYKLIMDKLNIPCEMSISKEMEHAWNVIKIDGNWYNVDVTYSLNSKGYDYFLKSDNYFKTAGHSNWVNENGVSCTDTKFDSML